MKAIRLKANFKPLKQAVSQVLLFGKSFRRPSRPPKNILDLVSKLFDKRGRLGNKFCSIKSVPTRGTGELRVVFEPPSNLVNLCPHLGHLIEKDGRQESTILAIALLLNSRVNDKGAVRLRPKPLPVYCNR